MLTSYRTWTHLCFWHVADWHRHNRPSFNASSREGRSCWSVLKGMLIDLSLGLHWWLKVYGTTNIRIVDMSVVPLHFAGHAQCECSFCYSSSGRWYNAIATAYVIGEKGKQTKSKRSAELDCFTVSLAADIIDISSRALFKSIRWKRNWMRTWMRTLSRTWSDNYSNSKSKENNDNKIFARKSRYSYRCITRTILPLPCTSAPLKFQGSCCVLVRNMGRGGDLPFITLVSMMRRTAAKSWYEGLLYDELWPIVVSAKFLLSFCEWQLTKVGQVIVLVLSHNLLWFPKFSFTMPLQYADECNPPDFFRKPPFNREQVRRSPWQVPTVWHIGLVFERSANFAFQTSS